MLAAAVILIVLALIGVPLFVVLAAGGLLASHSADISPDILIIEMNRLASSPNMIAIPLFTFAGVLMSSGGAPQRLVNLYRAAFGWMPGGLAIVTIGSCAFFTAYSGASGVTILALGGLYAGATDEEDDLLAELGERIGMLFQIRDDILDVERSTEELGKTAGKDAAARKLTYPGLYGLDESKSKLALVADEALELSRALPGAGGLFPSLIAYLASRDH